jgi:hypothetical protein
MDSGVTFVKPTSFATDARVFFPPGPFQGLPQKIALYAYTPELESKLGERNERTRTQT